MKYYFFLGPALLLVAGAALAQTVQVNQQNRTIEISANSSVEVPADLVSITVGYHNYGSTHDEAYDDSTRVSSQILKSWIDAGIQEREISTHSLSLNPVSQDDLKDLAAADRNKKRFEASQSWTITAKPDVAQRLLDIAVSAGANDIGDPDWKLSDPNAAEATAYASALSQARGIAEQMAESFGAKVGSLLYASNQARPLVFFGGTLNTESASLSSRSADRFSAHPVKLLPQKIEKSAFVRAIFALE